MTRPAVLAHLERSNRLLRRAHDLIVGESDVLSADARKLLAEIDRHLERGGEAVRYLSVCSGIEAASVAWHPLGWEPAAFSEIERFPRAVLTHHYPDVPLHGDFTTIQGDEYGAVDVLVGGTPCQSFSVAGLRAGMDDPRGNLALAYLGLAARTRARWLVWENVPGVLSSNGGRDFGAFLGGLAELGYGWAYRVLDAQYFGVPQRRRRVFVVGYLGDWRRAAAVLFEQKSLSWNSPPSREARKGSTAGPRGRVAFGIGSHAGASEAEVANRSHANGGPAGMGISEELAHSLRAGRTTAVGIAHTLRAEGFDASEDGTGRGTPLVPTYAIQERAVSENLANGPGGKGYQPGIAYTLEARNKVQALAFDTTQVTSKANRSNPKPGDPCHPLAAGAHPPAVAFSPLQGGRSMPVTREAPTLEAGTGNKAPAVAFQSKASASNSMNPNRVAPSIDVGKSDGLAIHAGMAVRRITPTEAERLQGFPDDYTRVPYRNKPAEDCPDGPRYKALGNSFAVPVVRWIGERIALVEETP